MALSRPVVPVVVIVLALSLSAAVKQSYGEQIFRSISPTVAYKMMAADRNILFVDVRTPGEIAEMAVDGAELVPMAAILEGREILSRDKPIILICAVGGRSYWVGRFLSSRGYSEVYNLSGGIYAWEREGLPVVRKKP
jgi:rhodanese-related sulfurtransferase